MGDVAFIDEPLAAHRRHGGNLSGEMVRQTDAVQMEIELFGVIDDVLSRIPLKHAGEVLELRQAAYQTAAVSVYSVACWAKDHAMEVQAAELEQMLGKYVSQTEVQKTLKPRSLRQRAMYAAVPLIKPLTYKKLRPVQAS